MANLEPKMGNLARSWYHLSNVFWIRETILVKPPQIKNPKTVEHFQRLLGVSGVLLEDAMLGHAGAILAMGSWESMRPCVRVVVCLFVRRFACGSRLRVWVSVGLFVCVSVCLFVLPYHLESEIGFAASYTLIALQARN